MNRKINFLCHEATELEAKIPKLSDELKALRVEQKEFYSKLTVLIDDIRAAPFIAKDSQLKSEQIAKRALRNKLANCGELVSVILTCLKLSAYTALSEFFSVECVFEDHRLLIVFKSDRRIPGDFFSQKFDTFGELCIALSKHTTGIIVDPWVNLTVDLTEYGALLWIAKQKSLDEYFTGTVTFAESSLLSCVLSGEKRMHEKHQSPEKIEKYRGIFSELTHLISQKIDAVSHTEKTETRNHCVP